jgi:hypothetical protein
MTPVLKFPATHDQIVLDTDASGLGIGVVLSQLQNGKFLIQFLILVLANL